VPRSARNPQFNKTSLPGSLKKAGIDYIPMPGLGGLRHARRDSPQQRLAQRLFRGYADYMQTPEFRENIEELIVMAREDRLALMCAEACPGAAHRSLIADALLVRGIQAEDIMSPTRASAHKLTPFAKVEGSAIT